MSYADLELKVVRWAEARSIVQHSNPAAQARKTLEEAGELLEAATAVSMFEGAGIDPWNKTRVEWQQKYRDALGDVLVTLIVGAATADVDLMECLAQAYDEIKDRKGTLRADGVFVKEAA
jgi:NTP pyrophosphatase (non-canonical NTP hydrolase)